MSSLRKQDVKRKTRKRVVSSSHSGKNPFLRIAIKIFQIPIAGVRVAFATFQKHPKASLITSGIIAALCAIAFLISSVHTALNNRLPSKIDIHSTDDSISEKVNSITWKTLQDARFHNQNRAHFLSVLSTRLAAIENIDSFKIRLGLNKKLEIWPTAQSPAFVLEAAESQRVLVSTRMIPIARLGSQTEHASLPLVIAPEARVSQKLTGSKAKSSGGISVSGINLPRVYRYILTFNSKAEMLAAENFVVTSFEWKQATGLSLSLSRSSGFPTQGTTKVVMGEYDLDSKMEKLLKVASHIAERNMTPENIDLNYPDRAIIRMNLSEAGTPLSL
jgi:hypothetical protein